MIAKRDEDALDPGLRGPIVDRMAPWASVIESVITKLQDGAHRLMESTHRRKQRLNPPSVTVKVADDPRPLVGDVHGVCCFEDLHATILPWTSVTTTIRGEGNGAHQLQVPV